MCKDSSSRSFAVGVMLAVAVYDVGVGLFMLAAEDPWKAHGLATLWSAAPPTLLSSDNPHRLVAMSLFRRCGAFSLFAGLITLYVARRYRRQPNELLSFMSLYMVAGLGFAVADGQYFSGTAYYWLKQSIGAAWALSTLWLYLASRGESKNERRVD